MISSIRARMIWLSAQDRPRQKREGPSSGAIPSGESSGSSHFCIIVGVCSGASGLRAGGEPEGKGSRL